MPRIACSIIISLLTAATVSAQPCDVLRETNATLQRQIDELRGQLGLNRFEASVEAGTVGVELVDATADTASNELTVVLRLSNSGVDISQLETGVDAIVMLSGQRIPLSKVTFGDTEISLSMATNIMGTPTGVPLPRGEPLLCTYVFEGVDAFASPVRRLAVPIRYTEVGAPGAGEVIEATFDGFDVAWR